METEQYRLLAEVEDKHWWSRALRRRVREALAKYRPGRGLQILDAGCGTGSLLSSLARDHHTVGVDRSALALVYCRNRGQSRLTAATVENLPFNDSVFDAVLSIDVLSHESIEVDS